MKNKVNKPRARHRTRQFKSFMGPALFPRTHTHRDLILANDHPGDRYVCGLCNPLEGQRIHTPPQLFLISILRAEFEHPPPVLPNGSCRVLRPRPDSIVDRGGHLTAISWPSGIYSCTQGLASHLHWAEMNDLF